MDSPLTLFCFSNMILSDLGTWIFAAHSELCHTAQMLACDMLRRPGGLGNRGTSLHSRGFAASDLQANTYPGVTGLGLAVVCIMTHKRGWSHFPNLVHMWIYNPTVCCCQNNRRLEVRNLDSRSASDIRAQGLSGRLFTFPSLSSHVECCLISRRRTGLWQIFIG